MTYSVLKVPLNPNQPTWKLNLQCFDSVGWVAGRASGL